MMKPMADEIAERFGAFSNGERKDFKVPHSEGPSGRSLLPNFCSKSPVSHWAFRVNRSREQIGAPDTVSGHAQCVVISSTYAPGPSAWTHQASTGYAGEERKDLIQA